MLAYTQVIFMDNKIIYNEIGKLVKKERKKQGITQEELANLTNYSLSFIANIESNTYQSFSIHTLYNLANALNISIHNLLPDKDALTKKDYKLIQKRGYVLRLTFCGKPRFKHSLIYYSSKSLCFLNSL